MPKKFDGSHRGFAFVEFVTHQEAENGTCAPSLLFGLRGAPDLTRRERNTPALHGRIPAFKALFNSHLYGRHLVLEWAKDDDSVEALRAKTARQVLQQDGAAGTDWTSDARTRLTKADWDARLPPRSGRKKRRLDDASLADAAKARTEDEDEDDA